ncbi:SDR family NAD(P)-dependent oxidoreductase [Neobacillus rhizophilus]|nr:glucose 1-dehydrogenase [Neobacillus rhizophilus]
MIDFSGKVALITGGGGEIGRAAAIALSKAGAKVAVVDISRELGEETVHAIKQQDGQAKYIYADVSKSEDVKNYVNKTVTEFGHIDVFINNAAWEGVVKPIVEYPDDVFDKLIGINVRGVFLGLKHVLPIMYAQNSGSIVNISSIAGHIGSPGLVAYTASKHAVLGMTKTAALEGAKLGIRVNAVCPGAVNTRMLHSLAKAKGPEAYQATMDKYETDSPDGRLAEPEEVANLVLYLSSELASHISGQSIRIDGGRVMS